jgi:hypothetical protein
MIMECTMVTTSSLTLEKYVAGPANYYSSPALQFLLHHNVMNFPHKRYCTIEKINSLKHLIFSTDA